MEVRWFRQLVAYLSTRSLGFDPKSVHVRFVVDIVRVGNRCVLVLQFSPISVIPPVLHTSRDLHTCIALTSMTDEQRIGTFITAMFFENLEAMGRKIFSLDIRYERNVVLEENGDQLDRSCEN